MYIGNIKGIADFLGKGINDINQHLSFNQFKVGSIKHRNAQRKMATKTGMTEPQINHWIIQDAIPPPHYM